MTERLFDLAGDEPAGHKLENKEREAAPSGPLRRVVLLVSYDGTAFHGFAPQGSASVRTVSGALAEALSKMVKEPVALTCAGRTDAGVHASGQVAHVDLPEVSVAKWLAAQDESLGPELPRLAKSLTSQCGPELVVARAFVAPPGFDARRSATARRYRYQLLRTAAADPLWRNMAWHVPGELDLPAMRIASDALLGQHDFASFCRRPPGLEGPLVRRLLQAGWKTEGCGERLVFEIEANAFCHRMVRSIVGSLVAVGQGKLTAADVHDMLVCPDRSKSAQPAPAHGLNLVQVRYPPEMIEGGSILPPAQVCS